jgi:eukaryotic-like serine/threonine-protein kinase
MPSTLLTCPDDTELLALAMGEPLDPAISAHVDECASCQAKRDGFQAQVALLRQNHGHATTPPSTEHNPTADSEGESAGAGMTQDSPAADTAGTETVTAPRDRSEGYGPVPDSIGRYKVVGWVDGGGEADVYRVVHIKLGNNLVLKLSRRAVGADDQSSLVQVGRILVDLEHPNLVRIFDLDFHEDRPFLVMEYVHGRDLQQFRSEEPVTARRAAALVAKLAEVMAVAHRHGITHCDIKPKNILIDKLGEPRLIDFGMARLRHAWSDYVESSVGGTFAYMAPEQARLEIDRIGPRSDIFALGGVLYFLLTGRAPFVGQDQDEVWARARRCDFDAGALRAAKVPRRLARICLRALAADPADRFATAEEMRRSLAGFLRRPVLFAGATVLLLIATIVAAISQRHGSGFTAPDSLPGQPAIEVHRGGEIIDKLSDALPLRTGDRLRIHSNVPPGYHVSAFWLDSEGRLAELSPLLITPGKRSDQLVYPRPEGSKDVVPLGGPSGTELLLICAKRQGEIAPGDVRSLFAGLGNLPNLPSRTFLVLDSESVEARGFRRELGAPEPSSVGDVREPLDQVRRKLRGRFEFVTGLAIPHDDTQAGQVSGRKRVQTN